MLLCLVFVREIKVQAEHLRVQSIKLFFVCVCASLYSKLCVPHYIHFAKRSKAQKEKNGKGEEASDRDRKRKKKD